MNSPTHYENANFLRKLAESLPRILPEGSTDKSALFQRLANEELARAEYDEQIRAKVAAARADKQFRATAPETTGTLSGTAQ